MKNKNTTSPGENDQSNFPFVIVGIGASAGGIEAITELLTHLSPNTGMAFIYVQHLDRDYESNLTEILARLTTMRVITAADQLSIIPNHVYVMPPDKELYVLDGSLKLVARPPRPTLNLPINSLFLSMAETLKERAIGIVLSGMASDGALGQQAIKQSGGITFAQDESAMFESMPKSAIAEGGIDFILSPKNMAIELERISHNKPILEEVLNEPESCTKDEEDENPENDEVRKADIKAIFQILRNVNGIDFTHYKMDTIWRRIVRRMLLHKFETLGEYTRYLKNNAGEISSLCNDLLIKVTQFFRDPEATEHLKSTIFPRLFKAKNPNEPLRVWVPACSTGEEAYSLAMIINEAMGDGATSLPVQIFATDLSETAILKARVGIYSTTEVQLLSPERLARFFTPVGGNYRVNKIIRDTCVFAPHNLSKDPPFSKLDIISCCNVLIYLDKVLQKKIMANFHYALNKQGYVVLGQSETVGSSAGLFTQTEKRLKIYAKKSDVTSRARFELNYAGSTADMALVPGKNVKQFVVEFNNNLNLEKLVDRIFLTEFSPAAVVVNYNLDILQFRGSTSLYLEPSPGQASLNLLKMARSGLAFELKNAANKVIKSGEQLKKSGVEINHQAAYYQVSFTITPLEISAEEKMLLVVFEELKLPYVPDKKGQYSKDRRVKQLENELLLLREDMRTIVEEQEAANEELQSANEEIVSSNEELQSLNEELETSKREIESSNEELMTINRELMMRNEQLAEANDYTEGVVANIRESILILDSNLRVKIANAAFYRTFNTNEAVTEGVLIFELGNGEWEIPRLKELLDGLLGRNSYVHGVEIKHVFKNSGEKVLLVNGKKIIQTLGQQYLILLAFEDITEHKQAERLLEEREAWLRKMTDSVPVMIWVASPDKNFTFLNKTWLAFTGRSLAKETGIGWTEGVHREDFKQCLFTYHEAFDKKTRFQIEYRMRRFDGEYRWVLNSAVPSFDSDDIFSGYIGSITEIHSKKLVNDELEQKVLERTAELEEVNKSLEKSNSDLQQFAYVASHDLQEPLRKIITFSNRLKEKFDNVLPEDSRPYIEKITSASKRMTDLINGLLDFSRADKPGNSIVETDLNQILKNVLTDLELLIQEKNARVTSDLLPTLQALPLNMTQLFYNLLSNGLKFTEKDVAPVVHITSRSLPQPEIENHPRFNKALKYHEMVFKDEGIGFPQEYAEQIFVIFQRLNDRQQFAGTGIGLALCRRIVENHNGEIYAESGPAGGASFHIILPETVG